MSLFIESFDSEYRDCLIATGTNVYRDGPERTVARIEFRGDAEQRKADFEALRAALESTPSVPDLFESMGLPRPTFPGLRGEG